jgi:hypothetical protein
MTGIYLSQPHHLVADFLLFTSCGIFARSGRHERCTHCLSVALTRQWQGNDFADGVQQYKTIWKKNGRPDRIARTFPLSVA